MTSNIILDLGSGATCDSWAYVKEAIDRIGNIRNRLDCKNHVRFKFQLFTPDTISYLPSLDYDIFERAYAYIKDYTIFDIGASVFDLESIKFLSRYDDVFFKIACRPWAYRLIEEIPDKYEIIVSVPDMPTRNSIVKMYGPDKTITPLFCLAEYPANYIKYESLFGGNLGVGISDHSDYSQTMEHLLYHKYRPLNYERHYCLEHDENVPDMSCYASTAKELIDIL